MPSIKEIWTMFVKWLKANPYVWIYPIYMTIYLIWFFTLNGVENEVVHIIHSPIDDLIPFNEYFVFPYASWFLALFFTPIVFMWMGKEDFLRLIFIMYVGMTICLIVYMIYPTGLDLRRPLEHDNFASDMVALIRSKDVSRNVCPSIHCSTSTAIILCHWFSRRLSGKKPIYLVVKILVTIWMCSVIVSTLFVKQHSIIDIYWGVGLSIVLFLVSYVPALLKKRNA